MYVAYAKDGHESSAYTKGDPILTQIALRYIVEAHPGEPLFVLRGRDLLLVPMIVHYERIATSVAQMGQMDTRVLAGVRQDAQAAGAWQAENAQHLKYADRA